MATTYDIDIKLNVDDSELQQASDSLQDLENNAENASNSTDELRDSIDNVGSGGLDDAADGASQVETSSDGASVSISNLGDNLGLINAGALLGIADEIGRIGESAEAMSQEMNTAAITVGQLATQTGIAEPQMVSLISNISNATFPQEEAMKYVKSLDQIGISSENLGKSATDLDRINDAFGLGADRTNSLGQELSVLGVDMNDVSSSFNALAYANSNTVGGMENYYNFLRRYDSQFNELGLNVDQASIIIAGATQKFGGGRAALTGLSDALKNADGDTRKLEEALGLQAGSLDNASQITGEYQGQLQKLADEEAEHKTLLDQVGAAWEDISLTLSPILAPLGSLAGILGGIGQAGLALAGFSSLAETLGLTGIAAEGASAGFFTLGAAELTALWPILAIVGAVALLAVGFEQLGEWMGWWTDFGSMFDSLRAGVMRLWDAFMNSRLVTMTIDALKGAFEALKNFVQPLWDELFNGAGEGGGGFDIVGLWIENFTMLEDVILAVIGIFQTFGSIVMSILTMIISPIQAIYSTWVSVFEGQTSIFDAIVITLQTLVGSYQLILSTLGTIISTILSAVLTRISSWATGLVSRARGAVSSFVSGIVNGLRGLPSSFGSALGRVLDAVTNWGGQLLQKATQIITDFANKIKNGISSAVDAAANAVTGGSSGFSSGFNGSSGFSSGFNGSSGFGGSSTLNSTLSNNITNTGATNLTVNNYMDGIMSPEHASDTIIGSLNDYTKKQNLIRGV